MRRSPPRLGTAVNIRLDEQWYDSPFRLGHPAEHVFQLRCLLLRQFRIARLGFADFCDLSCIALILDNEEIIPGTGRL